MTLLDPFDESVASYFNYKPPPQCPPFDLPFQVHPPNKIKRKDKYAKTITQNCHYTIIKWITSSLVTSQSLKEGPQIQFDPSKPITLNASFVRIQCPQLDDNKAFYLHIPLRPNGLVAAKATAKNQVGVAQVAVVFDIIRSIKLCYSTGALSSVISFNYEIR